MTTKATKKKAQRFFFNQDNSSHWYLIPVERRKEWDAFNELDEDDPAAWDAPEWAERLNMHISWYEFENAKEGQDDDE